jgi:hypothetical protein
MKASKSQIIGRRQQQFHVLSSLLEGDEESEESQFESDLSEFNTIDDATDGVSRRRRQSSCDCAAILSRIERKHGWILLLLLSEILALLVRHNDQLSWKQLMIWECLSIPTGVGIVYIIALLLERFVGFVLTATIRRDREPLYTFKHYLSFHLRSILFCTIHCNTSFPEPNTSLLSLSAAIAADRLLLSPFLDLFCIFAAGSGEIPLHQRLCTLHLLGLQQYSLRLRKENADTPNVRKPNRVGQLEARSSHLVVLSGQSCSSTGM